MLKDNQEFKQLKENMIKWNEQQFGEEFIQKHGEQSAMAVYGKIKALTEEQVSAAKGLENQLLYLLKSYDSSDGEEALLEIAELHKRWLAFYWPNYTKEHHFSLSEIYRQDVRFKTYYNERAGEMASALLIKSIELYTKE